MGAIARVTAKTAISALFFAIALGGAAQPAFANDLVGQEANIINRTNQVRAEVGLPALKADERLMRSAAAKAADMATRGYFGHATPEGNRMSYWIVPQGYVYSLAGENIAKGYHSLDRLMNAWINSPTHYENLIEPKFIDIGVGMAEGWYENQDTLFVVQHFGVEATQTAKDIGNMTAVVAPLIEQVAGTTEEIPEVNAPAQSAPWMSAAIVKPITLVSELPEPPAIQIAQAEPVSTGGVAGVVWPLWAIILLAMIGYVIDERFILWFQNGLARHRR